MIQVTQEEFEAMLSDALDGLPAKYRSRLGNLVFLVEDNPSEEQRQKQQLRCNQTLLGLYEGVPLPLRGGREKILPDKITLFKEPLERASSDVDNLRRHIGHTLWHEVAHYFGLDHQRIHELDESDIK